MAKLEYMQYDAIGEIILVVIGILIALRLIIGTSNENKIA